MGKFIDLTGQRFERITVIAFAGINKWRNARFLCKCDCGREWIVDSAALTSNKTKSCGCYGRDINTTHGLIIANKYPDGYSCWSGMKDRCSNKNNPQYHDYGGRGISVDASWLGENGFVTFIKDIGERPSKKHTIERIDNNGNYCKENCKWLLKKEQTRNTRVSRFLEANGKKMILADWVRELKIPHATLHYKLRTNSLESIISNYQ